MLHQSRGQYVLSDLVVMTEPEPSRRFATAFKLWQEVDRVGKRAGLHTV
jgi:hypothetical protein